MLMTRSVWAWSFLVLGSPFQIFWIYADRDCLTAPDHELGQGFLHWGVRSVLKKFHPILDFEIMNAVFPNWVNIHFIVNHLKWARLPHSLSHPSCVCFMVTEWPGKDSTSATSALEGTWQMRALHQFNRWDQGPGSLMCLVHLLQEFLHMLLANLRCVEKNLYSRHKSRGQAFVVQTHLVHFSLMLAHEAKFIWHMEGIYQWEHLSGASHKPFAHLGHVHTDWASDEHASVEESRNGAVIHQKLRQIKSGEKTLRVFARVPKVYDWGDRGHDVNHMSRLFHI